jgi:hypothetical protein
VFWHRGFRKMTHLAGPTPLPAKPMPDGNRVPEDRDSQHWFGTPLCANLNGIDALFVAMRSKNLVIRARRRDSVISKSTWYQIMTVDNIFERLHTLEL